MSVRYAHCGNNRVELNRVVSGMSNRCFRGNSPLSEYLTENKTQKYLILKLKKSLLADVEKVINEEQVFKYRREKLRGYKLRQVLCDAIEGCDFDTLKTTKRLMKKNSGVAIRYLLSITY